MFEDKKLSFWVFVKFCVIFLVPILLSAVVIANAIVLINTTNWFVVFKFIGTVVIIVPYLYIVMRYIIRAVASDKAMNWIEKPWQGPSISFKKKED